MYLYEIFNTYFHHYLLNCGGERKMNFASFIQSFIQRIQRGPRNHNNTSESDEVDILCSDSECSICYETDYESDTGGSNSDTGGSDSDGDMSEEDGEEEEEDDESNTDEEMEEGHEGGGESDHDNYSEKLLVNTEDDGEMFEM